METPTEMPCRVQRGLVAPAVDEGHPKPPADSSRVTFNQTGSIGIAGVEEKLTKHLEQKPDPKELDQELRCDRGYRRKKNKMRDNLESSAFKHNMKDAQTATQDDNEETETLHATQENQPESSQQAPSS